jgi:hypothetical protein
LKTVIVHIKDAITRGAVMLLVAMVSFSALADSEMVLWWLVGNDTDTEDLSDITINTFHQGQQTAESMDVHYARMKVVGTGGVEDYLSILNLDDSTPPTIPSINIPGEAYSTVITPYASPSYSFIIELGNWENDTWTMVAMSEAVSYTQLVNDHHVNVWSDQTLNPQVPDVWAVSSYTVPEPTSGLLLIVGGALLALRRRRRLVGE